LIKEICKHNVFKIDTDIMLVQLHYAEASEKYIMQRWSKSCKYMGWKDSY